MKKYLLSVPVMLLFACGNNATKESDTGYRDISIQLDTVMVDSKGEILMAATNGYGAVFSPDYDMMYHWDFESSQMEFIDLVGMKLVEKKTFEKEGPNGVGENSQTLKAIGDKELAFIGWDNQIAITDLDGNMIRRIRIDEPWITEGIEEKGSLSFLDFSEEGDKIYCRFVNFDSFSWDILELDIGQKTKKVIELPEFSKLNGFSIKFASEDGTSMFMSHPTLGATRVNGKVLFWANAVNSVYAYDPKTDSLSLLQYSSQLTASEKTGTYKNSVSTIEEMQKENMRMQEEVDFSRLIWDAKKSVFYRFTSYNLPTVSDEQPKKRTFLSLHGPNLELLAEKEITELELGGAFPHFAKDGKLYLFLNLDDELAYIRMTID